MRQEELSIAFESSLATEAIGAARHVAENLKPPGAAEHAAAMAASQSQFPQLARWCPPSIAEGNAGLCLLWAYLDSCFPDEGWDLVGKSHLERAATGAETLGAGLGLFSGVGGLAFAASQLSRGGTRYRRLLTSLDESITAQVMPLTAKLRQGSGMSTGDFDVISGLAGAGAALLARHGEPSVQVALANITDALVSLVTRSESPPAWYTPSSLLYDEAARQTYPYGNLNCGLAHGLPGVVGYLALARKAGGCQVALEKLDEAIVTAADWLCGNRADDEWGINWPAVVPLTATGEQEDAAQGTPGRSGWCYGAPGVARSLWLAGNAAGRSDYCDLAVRAMEDVFRRPVKARMIDSPSFCHGVAGLLAITLRFARETGSEVLVNGSEQLTKQILDAYRPESLVGFRNLEYRNNETDQPGLLDGAAGIAIVLLSAATGAEPSWDRVFLLS